MSVDLKYVRHTRLSREKLRLEVLLVGGTARGNLIIVLLYSLIFNDLY